MSIATCAKATFEARTMAPNVNPIFIFHPQSAHSERYYELIEQGPCREKIDGNELDGTIYLVRLPFLWSGSPSGGHKGSARFLK